MKGRWVSHTDKEYRKGKRIKVKQPDFDNPDLKEWEVPGGEITVSGRFPVKKV